MRLIDADALRDELGVSDEDIIFKSMLDDAPTIEAEPVKHGRWKVWTEKFLGVFCSECHKLADNKFNYCPNCGAKMDGGDNDA